MILPQCLAIFRRFPKRRRPFMDREGISFPHGLEPGVPHGAMPAPRPSPMPVQSLTPWTLPGLARALLAWVREEAYVPEQATTDRHA